MSYHLDRKEWDEHVMEKEWDILWAAYEYACDGTEPSTVRRLRDQVRRLQNTIKVLIKEKEIKL